MSFMKNNQDISINVLYQDINTYLGEDGENYTQKMSHVVAI